MILSRAGQGNADGRPAEALPRRHPAIAVLDTTAGGRSGSYFLGSGRWPTSVSAAFNDAMAAQRRRNQHALALLRERAAQADPERVARMKRHIDAQARAQGFQVASGE